jgi:hypothetical protein
VRVVALLAWFDERPDMLAELFDSLAGAGADGIVAVDGAYAEYPGARATSGVGQAEAIMEVATANGMEAVVHVPRHPWAGNEIEKRTFLFDLGHRLTEPEADWFWVVDGDEVVLAAGALRDTLTVTDRHVAECKLSEPGGREWDMRMFFRAQPTGITVGPYHARYETGDGRVLWASCHRMEEDPAATVPGCHVLNRPLERDRQRNHARRQYAERAVLLGLDQAMI